MEGSFIKSGIIVIIGLACGLFSCKEDLKNVDNPLVGKWISPYEINTYWEFDIHLNVNHYRKGKIWPGNQEIMISKKGKKPESFTFGPLYYKHSISADTIKFETIGSLNDKVWMRYSAIREGNLLYLWNYKTLPGIENHVDEVSYYCLEGESCSSTTNKRVKVIIESGLEGAIHISFNQKNGTPCQYDETGHPIITIDQGSIHKTTLPWHPAYMTHNAFDFWVKDCNDGSLTDINDWGHDTYRKQARDMLKTDSVTFKTQDYKLSAFSLGYNQYARDMLDYEFGEYLQGQVASFSIGYLNDRFVYKEYMKKVTSKGEDVKG